MSEIEVTCPVCSHKFYEWPQPKQEPVRLDSDCTSPKPQPDDTIPWNEVTPPCGRYHIDPVTGDYSIGGPDHSLQRALEAERQRIIEKNAPEIERINAWIDRDTDLLRQALEMLTAEYVLTDRLNEVVEALEERLK
jgi:hypothetical protein